MKPPVDVLRMSLHPRGLAPLVVNLAEWRPHLLERLRRQIRITGDRMLDALLRELTAYPGHPAPAGSHARQWPLMISPCPCSCERMAACCHS